MGTRGLTVVRQDGKERIAQYGQWDHYPKGQGLTALRFIREPSNVTMLRERVSELDVYTNEEANEIWKKAGANNSGWVTLDTADVVEAAHPELSRNTGAKILGLVASGAVTKVQLESAFANDTLWCEGIVTVDLDTNTLSWTDGYPERRDPIVFPFDNLPTEEDFCSACASPDDEDDD